MRLALNLGYLVGADRPEDQLTLTRHAESLGFDSVWAAEAYGSDSPTLLAWLAAQTTSIGLGSGVMQIPGRTPAMTAMTAASLDVLSGGRFRLGLGVSGPQVSEGWHGVRFAAPLGRTREYVEIVRAALAGELVEHDGRHFPLPLPDSAGKALKLTLRPTRADLPVYVAAVGPKNLQLAGEVADGWLAVFLAPSYAGEQLAEVAAGRAKVGKTNEGFDVVATVPIVVDRDPQQAAEPVRRYAALYVGGMGSRDQNFYNALAVRMGYVKEAATVQDLFLGGRPRDAAAAVPFDLIDDTSLLGDRDRIAAGLSRFAEAGVTTLALSPFGPLDVKLQALTVAAEALATLR